MENIFEPIFGNFNLKHYNSENLDVSQKESFVNFLQKYEDVFSENIVAGNCDIVFHEINIKDSAPIKQFPRKFLLQLRGEVDKFWRKWKWRG